MMEDFLGFYYTMDEIREVNGLQHCGEEVYVVKSLFGQLNVLKTSQSYAHSPPRVDPPLIEGEINETLLTPEH